MTCAKRAAAFAGADGTTTYVLFEQTYEKNVHPHRPGWHCLFIGHADAALERIFGRASSCEGGMLVSKRGWITPESYLTAWLKEMATPLRMPDREVRLWTGTTLYAPIPPALSGEIEALLAAYGLAGAADTIRTTGFTSLRLHAHAAAINALHGEQLIPAWRLIDDADIPSSTDRDAALGLQPSGRRQHEAETPNVLSAGSDMRLLQRADGRWYCAGWSYRIVSAYVCDAWKGGVEGLPRLRARIRAYRKAVEEAPPIPAGSRLLVTEDEAMSEHEKRTCAILRDANTVTPTATGFEVSPTPEALFHLSCLGPARATWVLPTLEPAPASQAGLL